MSKNKTMTLRTRPSNIVDEFKKVMIKGGTANLKTKEGYLSVVGGKGGILWKQIGDETYSFQRDVNAWVGPL